MHPIKERIHLSLWFQKVKNLSLWESVAVRGAAGLHHDLHGGNRPGKVCPPAKLKPLRSPKTTTWGLSIQIPYYGEYFSFKQHEQHLSQLSISRMRISGPN